MDVDTLVEQALTASAGRSDEAEARLLLLDKQRRECKYICYWEPAGDQAKFWAELAPFNQKTWLILGGERSGKTELGAFLAVAWLLGKGYFRDEPAWKWVESLPIPDGPASVRAVGLTHDLLRESIWEKLTGFTEHAPMFPDDGSVTQQSDHDMTATVRNGSKFFTKSADVDPKTHGGVSLDLAWLDEECSKSIFDMNVQRTITRAGKVLVTATPLDDVGTVAHPWIFDQLQKWQEGDPDIGVIFMDSENNPYTSDVEKRRMVARWEGSPEASARLHGIPTRRTGLFYAPHWKPEPPVWIPAYPLPKDAYRVVAIDPASTGYVGAIWTTISGSRRMTLYREYKERGLTTREHVENILTENRGDPIDLWLFDPYMGRQKLPQDHRTVLQLWRDSGLPRLRLADVDAAVALEASRDYLAAAHDATNPHPAVEVFDHLSKFRDEIERYVVDSVAQGPRRGEVRDRPRKGNDHLLNAWQYICGMRLQGRRDRVQLVPPHLRCHTARKGT